jgi:hypothetical protein
LVATARIGRQYDQPAGRADNYAKEVSVVGNVSLILFAIMTGDQVVLFFSFLLRQLWMLNVSHIVATIEHRLAFVSFLTPGGNGRIHPCGINRVCKKCHYDPL